MGNAPEGHLDTTPAHPSPTGTTPDQDRETMPPPARRPSIQRNTDLFDEAELRAVYNIHANTPLCGLVAALRGHLQDVNPNTLFAVVPLPHAASTDISVRQPQPVVKPGMQIANNLVDAWIWWFNFNQPDQGGVWVPHLGWFHRRSLRHRRSPGTRQAPVLGTGRPTTESQRPQHPTVQFPHGLGKQDSPRQGAQPQGHGGTIPTRGGESMRSMIVLESGDYYQGRIDLHPQECH